MVETLFLTVNVTNYHSRLGRAYGHRHNEISSNGKKNRRAFLDSVHLSYVRPDVVSAHAALDCDGAVASATWPAELSRVNVFTDASTPAAAAAHRSLASICLTHNAARPLYNANTVL